MQKILKIMNRVSSNSLYSPMDNKLKQKDEDWEEEDPRQKGYLYEMRVSQEQWEQRSIMETSIGIYCFRQNNFSLLSSARRWRTQWIQIVFFITNHTFMTVMTAMRKRKEVSKNSNKAKDWWMITSSPCLWAVCTPVDKGHLPMAALTSLAHTTTCEQDMTFSHQGMTSQSASFIMHRHVLTKHLHAWGLSM